MYAARAEAIAHMYSGLFPPAAFGLKADSIPGAVIERPSGVKAESGFGTLRAIATVIEPDFPKNSGSNITGSAGITSRPIGNPSFIILKKLSYPWYSGWPLLYAPPGVIGGRCSEISSS